MAAPATDHQHSRSEAGDFQLGDLLAAKLTGIVLFLLPVARFRRMISTVA